MGGGILSLRLSWLLQSSVFSVEAPPRLSKQRWSISQLVSWHSGQYFPKHNESLACLWHVSFLRSTSLHISSSLLSCFLSCFFPPLWATFSSFFPLWTVIRLLCSDTLTKQLFSLLYFCPLLIPPLHSSFIPNLILPSRILSAVVHIYLYLFCFLPHHCCSNFPHLLFPPSPSSFPPLFLFAPPPPLASLVLFQHPIHLPILLFHFFILPFFSSSAEPRHLQLWSLCHFYKTPTPPPQLCYHDSKRDRKIFLEYSEDGEREQAVDHKTLSLADDDLRG